MTAKSRRTHAKAANREVPFALATTFLRANPALAEALELFDVSLEAYERTLRGMSSTAHRVTSGGTTLTSAVDRADLG